MIDAYADMEKYYRPLLESDSDFDPRWFSGFVELQKENLKQSVAQAGYPANSIGADANMTNYVEYLSDLDVKYMGITFQV